MDPSAGSDDGFHRGEAISAVQDDEQFYGEDDDYDDLYNDVNVGEGFLQTLNRTEEKWVESPAPAPVPAPASALAPAQPALLPQQHHQQQQQHLIMPDPEEKVQIPGTSADLNPGELVVRPLPPPPPGPPPGMRIDLGEPSNKPPVEPAGVAPLRPGGGGGGGGGGLPVNDRFQRQGDGSASAAMAMGGGVGRSGAMNGGHSGGGGMTVFIGDLHWWTTDAELEAELRKYGPVKEMRFFDEKASGKSKGFCQVDFFDPSVASACKVGMDGHVFNGKPCSVAFTPPMAIRRDVQGNRNQSSSQQGPPQSNPKGGRGGGPGGQLGGNMGGRGGGGGGGGGGNWGRGGGGGMGNRGPMWNMRNRMGPIGGRGIMGNGGMHPIVPPMMGQGFDPTGYGVMGRMGAGYGGFPAGPGAAPFPGMLPSFPPVVAPHVNPAFFGRGMPTGGVGMWSDPSMGGWGGEEQSSYGEDAASDHQYGEVSHVKERTGDRDWSGASDRRHEREKDMTPGLDAPERRHHADRDVVRDRDMARDRERDWERERERERERDRDRERERERDRDRERDREQERDRYRDDRDRHGDYYNRHRDHRDSEREDDWERGRPSRARSKSHEVEHGKRHRPSPD